MERERPQNHVHPLFLDVKVLPGAPMQHRKLLESGPRSDRSNFEMRLQRRRNERTGNARIRYCGPLGGRQDRGLLDFADRFPVRFRQPDGVAKCADRAVMMAIFFKSHSYHSSASMLSQFRVQWNPAINERLAAR